MEEGASEMKVHPSIHQTKGYATGLEETSAARYAATTGSIGWQSMDEGEEK
jgi:hypothetical protein